MSTFLIIIALIFLLIVLGVWLYSWIRNCDYAAVDVEGGLPRKHTQVSEDEYPNRRPGGPNQHPDIQVTESGILRIHAKQNMTNKRKEIERYYEKKKNLRSPAGQENVDPNGSQSSIRAQITSLNENIKRAQDEMLDIVLEQFVDYGSGVIDLHGCHVDIALKAVKKFLQRLKDLLEHNGSRFAYIITGYGSSGTEAKIKPEVNKLLQNNGYKKNVTYWMINEGCFLVQVTK